MNIDKVFAELGRMHLELMQLRELLEAAQAELAAFKAPKTVEVPATGV